MSKPTRRKATHRKRAPKEPAPHITIGYVFGSKKPGRWQLEGDAQDQCEYTPEFLATLSDDEKRFLAQFLREYYDGDVKVGDRKAMHRTKKLRKECYQRNNLAYRDLSNVMRAHHALDRLDQPPSDEDEGRITPIEAASFHPTGRDAEDLLVAALDRKRQQDIESARIRFKEDEEWPTAPQSPNSQTKS